MTRNGLIVNNEVVTVAVLPDVQKAIESWLEANAADLDQALAQFDIKATDLAMPVFREVVAA